MGAARSIPKSAQVAAVWEVPRTATAIMAVATAHRRALRDTIVMKDCLLQSALKRARRAQG